MTRYPAREAWRKWCAQRIADARDAQAMCTPPTLMPAEIKYAAARKSIIEGPPTITAPAEERTAPTAVVARKSAVPAAPAEPAVAKLPSASDVAAAATAQGILRAHDAVAALRAPGKTYQKWKPKDKGRRASASASS
jgi:hypothetical protein